MTESPEARINALTAEVANLTDTLTAVTAAMNSMATHTLALEALMVGLIKGKQVDREAALAWVETRLSGADAEHCAAVVSHLLAQG